MTNARRSIVTPLQAVYYSLTRAFGAGLALYLLVQIVSILSGDSSPSQLRLFVVLVVGVPTVVFITHVSQLLWFLPPHSRLMKAFRLVPLFPQQSGYERPVRITEDPARFLQHLEHVLRDALDASNVVYESAPSVGFTCRIPFRVKSFANEMHVRCGPEPEVASLAVTSHQPNVLNYVYPIDVDAAKTLAVLLILCAEHRLIPDDFDETVSKEQLQIDLGDSASPIESYFRRGDPNARRRETT